MLHHRIDVNDRAHRNLLEPKHEIGGKIVHFGTEGQDVRKAMNLGPVELLLDIDIGEKIDLEVEIFAGGRREDVCQVRVRDLGA